MHVIRSGACRNSPKNAFVEEFVIDFLSRNTLDSRVEDTTSRPAIPPDLTGIEIWNAISHGKIGAANGRLTTADGETPFAVFLEFATAKGTLVRKLDLYFAPAA